MYLTEKHIEQIIAGVITIASGVAGFFLSRLAADRDEKKRLDRELRRFQGLIEHNQAMEAMSPILRELKNFLLANHELLRRKWVKRFFDKWLIDPMLDGQDGHSQMLTLGNFDVEFPQVKLDSHWLTDGK